MPTIPCKRFPTFLCVFAMNAASVLAQPVVNLPRPDSAGWIKLFRGSNTSDFYTFYTGTFPVTRRNGNNFPDNTFRVRGDTVQVTGSPTGHMIFKQPFSHYRIRYQMRFPGGLGNCGMLLHIQESDSAMWNQFPRSIESQGDPNQGMGQIWAIGRTWVTVRARMVSNTPQYDPAAAEIDYGASDDNHRLITGLLGYGQPRPAELNNGGWITQEADVRGNDSLSHSVMGQTLIKYRRPRVAPRNNPNQVEKLLQNGLIAWQSEGVAVWYRNIEIRLYPQDPLYAALYNPTGMRDVHILPKPKAATTLRFRDGTVLLAEPRNRMVSALGRAPLLPVNIRAPE